MSKAREVAKMGEVLTNSQIGGQKHYSLMVRWLSFKEGSQASTRTSL